MRTVIIVALAVVSFSVAAQRRITPTEYIEKYKHLAISDMQEFGIPASVKMAQALLESDAGNSRLAVQGNNHFGIKCKRDWAGQTIDHDDETPGECFRKYASAEASFHDHARFLSNSARYERLFALDPMDYKAWAQGLKDCGYATSPVYPQLLIDMIEKHQLYRLDIEQPMAVKDAGRSAVSMSREPVRLIPPPDEERQTATGANREQITIITGRDLVPEIMARGQRDEYSHAASTRMAGGRPVYHNNGTEFIFAQAGDTYENLAAMTGIKIKAMRKINDAEGGIQPVEGEYVYLHTKANSAINGHVMHSAAKGESLRDIAQRYGIRLAALTRLNRIQYQDTPLIEGQQIRLM